MSKFNEDITLWMADKEGKSKQFYAFSNEKNIEKAIQGLLKRMMWPNRFSYPLARVYNKTELLQCYIQGNPVKHMDMQLQWYGPGISAFKMKIILNDATGTQIGPFYSNGTVDDAKKQFYLLVDEYLKYKHKLNFISAIVMDVRGGKDEMFARIKLSKDKKILINNCKNDINSYLCIGKNM